MKAGPIAIATALGFGVAALLSNTFLRFRGWTPRTDTPRQRAARLASHWRIVRPEGNCPAPVAILLSGCDGVQDNMDLWTDVLGELGWASLILDSHAPRDLLRVQRWRLVCSGQALTGAERAGDIAVALDAIREIDELDSDRVILLGASHGGWAVTEFIHRAEIGACPPGLTDWPALPDSLLTQLSGTILLYPYCGSASVAARVGWRHTTPVLTILAGADRIVSVSASCRLAETLADRNVPVEVAVLDGACHGFDQKKRSALSPLAFDADATDRAAALVRAFVKARPSF